MDCFFKYFVMMYIPLEDIFLYIFLFSEQIETKIDIQKYRLRII